MGWKIIKQAFGEIYSDKVYLGVNDSPENWHEIPDMGTIV